MFLVGSVFGPLRIFCSVSQSLRGSTKAPQWPQCSAVFDILYFIAPSISRMLFTSELRTHRELFLTLIFSTGIISPHTLHCPFLAAVYSFLSAVFHIPPGEAVENRLHSEPARPHQCWEQKLSSLNSCAVFAIKMMMWGAEGENNLLKLFCSDSRSFTGDVSQSLECCFQGTSHSVGIQSVLWEAQYSWSWGIMKNNCGVREPAHKAP